VGDLVPDDPRTRYVRLDQPLVLGAKRNLACELARGGVIAHWDDDDWYAADRLSVQLEALERHGADVCGPARLLFLEPAAGRAWLYRYPGAVAERWLAGSGLCYRAAAWRRHPFAPVASGEDTAFVRRHRRDAPAVALDDRDFLVGVIHDANSDHKQTSAPGWSAHPLDAVRALMGPDFARYERS
jgi:glycosyl transferase family 2